MPPGHHCTGEHRYATTHIHACQAPSSRTRQSSPRSDWPMYWRTSPDQASGQAGPKTRSSRYRMMGRTKEAQELGSWASRGDGLDQRGDDCDGSRWPWCIWPTNGPIPCSGANINMILPSSHPCQDPIHVTAGVTVRSPLASGSGIPVTGPAPSGSRWSPEALG